MPLIKLLLLVLLNIKKILKNFIRYLEKGILTATLKMGKAQ